jgi:hypothetical protein
VDILILQVFVSLLLVVSSVILFGFTCRQRSFDHSDRLALLPMEDDGASPEPLPSPLPRVKDPQGNES